MVRTCGRCDSDHQTGIDKDHEQYKKAKARVDKARAEILRLKQENKERLIKEAEEAGKDLRTEMVQIEVTAEEIAQEAAEEPSQSVDELVTLEFQEEEEGKPTRIIQVITGPRCVSITLCVSIPERYLQAYTCRLG